MTNNTPVSGQLIGEAGSACFTFLIKGYESEQFCIENVRND